MPRLPRIYVEGAVYFVTCRSEHGQDIFKEEKDYKMFLELLKKYKEQYDIKIFAYALMPDHLHLLVEMTAPLAGAGPAKSQEISDFMHNLNNAYTKYFNAAYERKGHLFRERFKAAIVEKENYLLKMTVYLHLNPQKLNLTSDASTYPYGSYSQYLGNEAVQGQLNLKDEITEIFSLLGEKKYSDIVKEMTPEDAEFLHKRLSRGGILGSDDFVNRVRSNIQAFQAQDGTEEAAAPAPRTYRIFAAVGSLVLIFAASLAAGTYYYFVHKKPAKAVAASKTVETTIETPNDLNSTEWQIKVIPIAGAGERSDIVTFKDGKFVSASLDFFGYSRSNYSITTEERGRLVWETMQSTANGTASWRGEIEQGKMRGILSLREEGKAPQDFSFESLTYRRK